jgi:hypothetical protein
MLSVTFGSTMLSGLPATLAIGVVATIGYLTGRKSSLSDEA